MDRHSLPTAADRAEKPGQTFAEPHREIDAGEAANADRYAYASHSSNDEIFLFAYPFDHEAISLWRQWAHDQNAMHGLDPDFVLPFLESRQDARDARLIMRLHNGECQLAVVIEPDNSRWWSKQSWRLFDHDHLDANGFATARVETSFDQIFDLAEAGLVNEGGKISRLSIAKMQCVSRGDRKLVNQHFGSNAHFDLDGSNAYQIPGKLNRNIRRNAKKMEECYGPIRLDVAPSNAENLRCFFDVEAAGWKNRANSAIRSDANLRQAYENAFSLGKVDRRAYVFTLRVKDHAVASAYGIVYAGHVSLLKIGFDEQYSQFSPGSIMVAKILDYVRASGRSRLFLSTYPDWSVRWKPALQEKINVHVFSDCVIGRTRYLLQRSALAVERLLRRVLRPVKKL